MLFALVRSCWLGWGCNGRQIIPQNYFDETSIELLPNALLNFAIHLRTEKESFECCGVSVRACLPDARVCSAPQAASRPPSFCKVATRYLSLFGCVGVLRKRSNSETPAARRCAGRRLQALALPWPPLLHPRQREKALRSRQPLLLQPDRTR